MNINRKNGEFYANTEYLAWGKKAPYLSHNALEDTSHELHHTLQDMERRFKEHGTKPSMHTLIHTHLLQLVGLGLVLVPVGIFPVGQAEGPH